MRNSARRQGKGQEKKKRGRKVMIVLSVLLLLFLAITVGLHECGNLRYPWEPKGIISGTKGKLPGSVDSGTGSGDNVTLVINSMPVFENGAGKGSLMIENSESNTYAMRVEIFLGSDNTGESIYKTNSIPPGYYIDYDYLTKALPKGTHPAIAYFTFYDGERAASSAASVNLEILVKN